MKRLGIGLMIAVPAALFCWACYLVFSAPPEPPVDWRLQMSQAQHDAVVALLNHLYTRAAYTITWAIQLGYLAWMGLRWRSLKQRSER